MKIAIIGAGFSGLALTYYLSQDPKRQITLFDKRGIGGGASGIAAGLLHPYVGGKALLNWKGQESLAETRELLKIASQNCTDPVFQESGIIRIPKSEEQKAYFQKCAVDHDDVEICDIQIPGVEAQNGILIKSGIQVHCENYLKGLWMNCQERGCQLQIQEITDLESLKDYDRIVICNGVSQLSNKKLKHIKGQLLRLQWPSDLPPLQRPVIGSKYVAMDPDLQSCWVGATYEHNFSDDAIDMK
ncbi:MAG: tRNA 5-methylaminomethyl-2-thiouridine biosynthesis bifunctional protein MnmC, partial [Chlamydiae bacterium]|nr:tRNA 5-methylaminomethyl-2-thiouridine biosynthesis bifunctional protein MnmC [Chlamydiota bacterium]